MTTVVYDAKGREVGHVHDGMFHKRVRGSVHFLKNPPAICFDRVVVDRCVELGVTIFEVVDGETNKTYHLSRAKMDLKGFYVARGYGEQVGIRLTEWTIVGEEKPEQARMF